MSTNLDLLTNEELFDKLKYHGLQVGPVTATTRNLYLKKLKAYLESQNSQDITSASASTSTPDIIHIKSKKGVTVQTDFNDDSNNEDEDNNQNNVTTSPKIPFEFKLIQDTPPTNLYPRLRQATQSTPTYSNRQETVQQSNKATTQATSNGFFNIKVLFILFLILTIVYYLYDYIQNTNPINPIGYETDI